MEIIFGGADNGHLTGAYACALGFFDGIHIGHQNLITALKDVSKQNNLKSMVFTFQKHPMTLLKAANAPKLITDNTEKSYLFDSFGIDFLYFSNVTEGFLKTDPGVFINDILINKLNVKAIIAGFNFRFGYEGRGDSNTLLNFGKESGIDVNIVKPVYIDGILVSSTSIREYLSEGNITKANKFLGRPYSMHGKVVHGKKRGNSMGFPTANINIGCDLVVPKSGVYITKVLIDNEIEKIGITNIGSNPTFGNDYLSIETHIVDYNKDIYNKEIKIYFYDRIREEKKFKNISELTDQISSDRMTAVRYFA